MRTHRRIVCIAALALASALSAPARAQQPAAAKNTHTTTAPVLAVAPAAPAAVAEKGPGPVTGDGTIGQIPIWTGEYTVGSSIITANLGNVGIGTLTPTSRLTVFGTIESTKNGFKFPDGTMQTTAGLSLVSHDFTLMGMGTSDAPLGISPGGVRSLHLGVGAVTAPKLATEADPVPGQVLGFTNRGLVWMTPATSINSVTHDRTLTGDGNATPLGIADGGVGRSQLADGAVNGSKIAPG